MKTSLHFLPRPKRNQIMEIADIIKEAADPEMIMLFGSYAKGTLVEFQYEYVSDFDFRW
jgi:predicted nucleotidyltransferase